ncbi:hypothetical protein U1P98_09240 [Lysinibacillus irui]|uniref:Uncharacterized protein n=1 Tax=Lysinibacillus irui TaxID=2998077 RepID=A0ABU5NK97_9BACI|nr:hypothetical protein [Lysinibacillus irui]MEA0554758.1 hypothetical protein [Lysinibacillus irui]MEA0976473.1 hypothetical protein [Lysinibacillus irui]MEA1042627.1 hypothetical protein [Lysinibacillus irui]
MRFGFLSLHDVESTRFITLLVYQDNNRGISHEIASISRPFDTVIDVIDLVIDLQLDSLETDSQQLYRDLIVCDMPIIYRRELDETKTYIDRVYDELVEIYELNTEAEAQHLAKWRLFIIKKLERLIAWLKKETDYANI